MAHGVDAPAKASIDQQSAQPPASSSDPGSQQTQNTPSSQANAKDLWRRKYLFGDWAGSRTRFANKGVTFNFYYTDDALVNPAGGRTDFAVWGRIRGTMNIDFSKLTAWQGLTFHITGLWQYGTDLSKQYTFTAVDSTSLPSAHTLRADSYFLQQYLFDHKLALRGGQIAAYDSYGDAEYGASFINLALGYAHSNLNSAAYLSFNPAGVPAFEVKVLPTDHFYLKAMVESEERNPYITDPNGFTFHLGGPVLTTEAGYLHDPPKVPDATATMGREPFITDSETGNYPGVYRVGAGYDPHNFTDLLTGASIAGNYVVYGQIEQAVYRMKGAAADRKRGIDLTYSEDYAPGDVTQYSQQLWAGARWIGPASGRWSKDTIGLGYVRTAVGSHSREAALLNTDKTLTAEHLVEVNYLANMTPWLQVQPVAQAFVKPEGDTSRGNVFVLGFRTKVTF